MRRLLIIPILVPTVAFGQAVTFGLGARPNLQARSANFINSFSTFYPQAGVSIPAGGGNSMGSAPLVIAPPAVPTAPTGNLPNNPVVTPITNTPSTGGPNVVLPNPVLPNPSGVPNMNNNVSTNPGLPPNVIGMPGGFNGGVNQPINGGFNGGFNGAMPINGGMPGQPPIIAGPLTGGGQQFQQFPMYQQPYMPMPRPYYPGYGRQNRNSGLGNFAQLLGGLASAFMGGGGFGGGGFGGGGFGNGFGGAGFGNAGYSNGGTPVQNFYTPKTSQVSQQPGPVANNDVAPDEFADTESVQTGQDTEVAAARDAAPSAAAAKATAPDEYADASCDDCDAGPRKNPAAPAKLPTAKEEASVATEADDSVTEASAATPGATTPDEAKPTDDAACAAKDEASRLLCTDFNKAWAAKGFNQLKLSAAMNDSAKKHAADIANMMKNGKEFDLKVKDRTDIKSGYKGSDGSTMAARFQKLGIVSQKAQIIAWYPGDAKATAAKALADWTKQDWSKAGTILKYAGIGHSTLKNKDGQTMTVWTMMYSAELPKAERPKSAK